MPIEVTVTITGQPDRMAARFKAVNAKMADWRPAFDAMHEAYETYEEHVFASEGAAHPGGPWVPLSPRYAAWKAVHFPGRPIMTRTGALREAAGDVIEMTNTRLTMGPGDSIAYAKWAGRKRPFAEPSPALIQTLTDIATAYLQAAVDGT